MYIKAMNLGKKFKKNWVLKNINLDVESMRIAILGPGGSGKTTFLTIASGISNPSEGELVINGHEPYRERDWAIRYISFMFSNPRYNLYIKVEEVVKIISDMRGCRDEGFWLAKQLGLDQFFNQRLYSLTTTQSHLVELWISLVCWKEIVLLDEPFINLDDLKTSFLIDYLREYDNLVFSTSNPIEAEVVADYIIVLVKGRVEWSGFKQDLFKQDLFELIPYNAFIDITEFLKEINCVPIGRFGLNILVSNCEEDKLKQLIFKKIIIGYKKAGVRSLYASLTSR